MLPQRPRRVVEHAERGKYIVGAAVGAVVGAAVGAAAAVDTAAVGAAVGIAVVAAVVAGNTRGRLPVKVDGRDPRSKSTFEKAPGCEKVK